MYSTSSEPNGNVLKLFAVLHYSELGSLPPGAGQRLKEESTLYKVRRTDALVLSIKPVKRGGCSPGDLWRSSQLHGYKEGAVIIFAFQLHLLALALEMDLASSLCRAFAHAAPFAWSCSAPMLASVLSPSIAPAGRPCCRPATPSESCSFIKCCHDILPLFLRARVSVSLCPCSVFSFCSSCMLNVFQSAWHSVII